MVALAVAAGVPVTFAILHNGFPVSDVTLTSKDVWVTNDKLSLAGRLNRQIDELTAGAQAVNKSIDVVQDGAQVFLHDEDANTLQRIVRSSVTLVQKTPVPDNAEISLGKDTMTIVDPSNGKLWVINIAAGINFDQKSQKPDAVLGAGGEAVVGRDGIAYATSPSHSKMYRFASAGSQPSVASMSLPKNGQLSVVGDTPVDLDAAGKMLITGGGTRIALKGTPVKIQQPGSAASSALIATEDGLLTVSLDGKSQTAIAANIPADTTAADIAAPVDLEGCDYGAWAEQGRYLQDCSGRPPVRIMIEQDTTNDDLVFRVNRNVIALNDLQNGNTWVLSQKLKLVNNWDEIVPPQESKVTKGHQKSTEESFQDTLAKRTPVNHPPVARPDSYGIRPGRTTILPVLDNDTDQDGDVLEVTKTTPVSTDYGKLDLIEGGRALQFTPSASATGNASFVYTVSDGRGGVAQANVDLSIVQASENRPPKQLREAAVSVEAGQSIQYNVLTDWQDPDGDDLELKSASPTTADGVQFTPDGFITFQNKSGQTGVKTVDYEVTDGRATVSGKLTVTVKPAGTLSPVGTPDFAQVFVGNTVVVQPLQNDLSPSGQPLSLVSVQNPPYSAQVTANVAKAEVSVSSSKPGTIYLTYKLAAGSEQSEGIMRIDVLPNPDKDIPPIAVKDVAYVRAGQPTTVTVLDNDVSPLGRVLAVQSVNTDKTSSAIKVELLNNTNIGITAPNGLTAQTQFTYTISDGENTSVAGVTVVPVPPIVDRQPPIAVNDTATVRADDIVSVDVLANDYSPDQEQISLDPVLPVTSSDGGGLAFVNGDTVRYEAPDKAGQYSVVYRIVDQYGQTATASVLFTVTAKDPATDQPPAPQEQTARAFSGSTVRINVPLDGIDPDGDSVTLGGITQAPELGTIVDSGPTWFDYRAFSAATGTDKFEYSVKDSYGATGTGTIQVGVIPRANLQAPPDAVDDNVDVKPGKTVSAQVLLNDSDPNLYSLTLSKTLLAVSPALKAHVTGSKVIISAPSKQGEYSLRYQISNGHGGTASAFVTVNVTPNAKPLYPTATDDYITASKVKGSKPIKVAVEPLIDNPNGEDSALVISAEGPNAGKAQVDQSGGIITVTPRDARYAIAYRVTDPTDKTLTATAFIVVPPADSGKNIGPPHIKYGLAKQVVPQDGTRTWKLADIVTAPSGKPTRITTASSVKAINGDGSSAYVDDDTIKYTAPKGYRGTAAVVFEVTDGASATDPTGRKAVLTLNITVGDPNSDDVAPTFTLVKEQIQAGEQPTTIDLRDSTSDPNRNLISQFSYGGLGGQTSNIAATLSGSKLSMSSPLGVQPGATTTLDFTIRYKNFVVPGQVQVTVVKSTRPLAQAIEDDALGQRGDASTVNVLDNDINPYADVNKPLKVVAASVENSSQTSASVSFTSAGVVTIHPDATFIGTVSVVYTVEDASLDPSREVQGRFLLSVRDVPDKPNPPSIISEQDGSVTIGWQAPADNNAAIKHYTISTSGGIAQKVVDVSDAQTTISGLTNGTAYTFQISATNALGDGANSASSAPAIPFGKPGAPTSASIAPSSDGSGKVTMTWGAANGNGRAVSGYTWTISGAGASPTSGTTTGLSASTVGTVGTAYKFTVYASNSGGLNGAATTSSNSAMPTPGKPTVTLNASSSKGDYGLTGSWGSAAAHGFSDGAIKYSWSITGSGLSTSGSSNGGSSGSWLGTASHTYTLTVTATVNGVSNSASDTATTPAAPDPSYVRICRSFKSGDFWYAGVQWSGLSANSRTFTIENEPQWGPTSVSSSAGSGTIVTQAYRAFTSASDKNIDLWIDYDGTSTDHNITWGATPVC